MKYSRSIMVSAFMCAMLFQGFLSAQTVSAGFEVVSAKYGIGDTWLDVTAKVKEQVAAPGAYQGYIAIPADMNKFFGKDPAPGKGKSVVIKVKDARGEREIIGKEHEGLRHFQPGTIVALKSVKWGKYLGVKDGKFIGLVDADKNNPMCQLSTMNSGEWIGFKSYSAYGRNLQAVPVGGDRFQVRFENFNFLAPSHSCEHWKFIVDKNYPDVVRLRNQVAGWFCVVDPNAAWAKGHVWTAWKPNQPAGPGDWERLYVEVVKPAPTDIAPGGKTFTHLPELDGETLKWHENWKIAEPGKGWVKFKWRGTNEFFVAFSTLPQDVAINHPALGADYRFVIGGWGNIQSTIRKSSGGAWIKDAKGSIELALSNIKKGGNPQAIVTGGKPGKGEQWEDYWFKVDNGTVSWGKGTVVGQNEMMRYVDPAPLGFVQYVSLGGWYDVRGEFKDIEFSKIEPAPKVINLPEFETEEGKAKRITTGSKDGELEVWVVGFDDMLYRYDTYSMAPVPWVRQEFKDAAGNLMKFEDISCSSDGTLVALDAKGKALRYNWADKKWTPIEPGKGNEELDFEFITAGNKDCIWAVDVDSKDIYELTKTGWVVRADGIGIYAAAGVDGTVVALNEKGQPYRFENGKWMEVGSGVKFERIAVGNKDNIIGSTGADNVLWQWKNGAWEQLKDKDGKPVVGLDEISINAVGTIFGADDDGDIYHKGEAGVSLVKPTAEAVKAAIAKAVAAGKPAPKAEVIEKKLAKAEKAKAKKETRAKAKKEGKIKKKAKKKKTTGKGKALKKAAKAKKKAKKISKIKKKATKKLKKKASKKKKGVKKGAKKSKKKSAKKSKAKKKSAKKSAKKSKKKSKKK